MLIKNRDHYLALVELINVILKGLEKEEKMKKIFFGLSMFAMIVFMAIPAYALPYTDYVDIGNIDPLDPNSEVGHTLVGWGPIVTPSGGWGGGSSDGSLRVISSFGTGDWASIDLEFDGIGLSTLHLEGRAQDSFYVYIDADPSIFSGYEAGVSDIPGYPAAYYPGDDQTTEYWISTTFDFTDTPLFDQHIITFLSDQTHWDGWNTYGQVAISSIGVEPIPEPSTMLLLGAGLLGLAGFGRKKFFKK